MGEKTVRVRVAVAVGMELGEHVYGTAGWSGGSDKDMVNEALDAADLEHRSESVVHFIEADIPIPEPQTIEATVDRAKAIPRERGDEVRERCGDYVRPGDGRPETHRDDCSCHDCMLVEDQMAEDARMGG